jgi:hypothetical protein
MAGREGACADQGGLYGAGVVFEVTLEEFFQRIQKMRGHSIHFRRI